MSIVVRGGACAKTKGHVLGMWQLSKDDGGTTRSFVMGSPDGEEKRMEDESPQHRVTLSRQFAVGQFALTFDEWDLCVADGGCFGYKPGDQGWGHGRQPVVNVSWA